MSNQSPTVRRDSHAWRIQVWVAFGLSIAMLTAGMMALPFTSSDAVVLAGGTLFMLSSTFALAKTLRDNEMERVDTNAWIMQVWISFAAALTMVIWGLTTIKVDPWQRYFLMAASVFALSSCFTLAKTLRDNHDADLIDSNAPNRLG